MGVNVGKFPNIREVLSTETAVENGGQRSGKFMGIPLENPTGNFIMATAGRANSFEFKENIVL